MNASVPTSTIVVTACACIGAALGGYHGLVTAGPGPSGSRCVPMVGHGIVGLFAGLGFGVAVKSLTSL